jgi:hypothetical protein
MGPQTSERSRIVEPLHCFFSLESLSQKCDRLPALAIERFREGEDRLAGVNRFLFPILMVSFVSCGGDSSPTGASKGAPGSASLLAPYGGGQAASNGTTVAEILANPSGFLGQQVELQGRATERFSTGELLFTDATGSMPADFSAAGSAPDLNLSVMVSGTVAAGLVGGFSVKIAVLSWAMAPAFGCEDIVEVRARFTDPGYTFGNVAGLFLSYRGVPPGEKILKVFWDVENPSGAVEELAVGEGDGMEDGLFYLEGIVSHEYPDVKGTEAKKVRAELSIQGREGSCARVRDLTLTQGSGPGWAGGGTIEVSIDEGTTIESGSSFAVRAKISNPTSGTVDVHVLFDTPDKSKITDASGEGCQLADAETVECALSLNGGERVTRVVRYQAPVVAAPIQIAGSAGLVTGEFAPVVPYRITVQP